jgi:subtilase family serine protease
VITAVENRGGTDAGKFYVDLYLTNRSVQTAEPLLLGTWEVGSVPATGQASSTRTFTIPRDILAGEYGVLMVVDPGNLIPESNEENNDWYRDGMIRIIAGGPQTIAPPSSSTPPHPSL